MHGLLILTRTPLYPWAFPGFEALSWLAIIGFATNHAAFFATFLPSATLRADGRSGTVLLARIVGIAGDRGGSPGARTFRRVRPMSDGAWPSQGSGTPWRSASASVARPCSATGRARSAELGTGLGKRPALQRLVIAGGPVEDGPLVRRRAR